MRFAHEDARIAAESLIAKLEPDCERIQVAGSIRRKKPTVKDIEIVAIPKFRNVRDLFGEVSSRHSLLDERLSELGLEPRRREDGALQGIGSKAKFYYEPTLRIPLDLFVCSPETWGVIFTLRTGSAEFNLRLVKHLNDKGFKMRDGRILAPDNTILETREERDVFRVLRVKWREPEDRT